VSCEERVLRLSEGRRLDVLFFAASRFSGGCEVSDEYA